MSAETRLVPSQSVSRSSLSSTINSVSLCRCVRTARLATTTSTQRVPAPSVCTLPDKISWRTAHILIHSSTSVNIHTSFRLLVTTPSYFSSVFSVLIRLSSSSAAAAAAATTTTTTSNPIFNIQYSFIRKMTKRA